MLMGFRLSLVLGFPSSSAVRRRGETVVSRKANDPWVLRVSDTESFQLFLGLSLALQPEYPCNLEVIKK